MRINIKCKYCGTEYQAKRSSRKYCSDTCKTMAYRKRKEELQDLRRKKKETMAKSNKIESDHAMAYRKFNEKLEQLFNRIKEIEANCEKLQNDNARFLEEIAALDAFNKKIIAEDKAFFQNLRAQLWENRAEQMENEAKLKENNEKKRVEDEISRKKRRESRAKLKALIRESKKWSSTLLCFIAH